MKLFLNVLKYIVFFFGVVFLLILLALAIFPSADYCIEDGNCPECPTKEGYTCITKEDCIKHGYFWHEDDRWCKTVPSCEVSIAKKEYEICWTPDGETHFFDWSDDAKVERFRIKYPKQ